MASMNGNEKREKQGFICYQDFTNSMDSILCAMISRVFQRRHTVLKRTDMIIQLMTRTTSPIVAQGSKHID